ncbi:MAG: hypothetical protein EHV01_003655 [Spiroplasma sp. hy2]|uniref:hypothetical protein n=1 Tax=Spiroplasma sp. hy2 TaxID=2490850 RepID=UPI003B4BC9F6
MGLFKIIKLMVLNPPIILQLHRTYPKPTYHNRLITRLKVVFKISWMEIKVKKKKTIVMIKTKK